MIQDRLKKKPVRTAYSIIDGLGKLPPCAIDLEKSVLGAILVERDAILGVSTFLKPEHFYDSSHIFIYEAILSLDNSGYPIDMRTVTDMLRKHGKLEIIGGAYYIAELTSQVSSAANIEYHARIVIEYWLKRSVILISNEASADGYDDTVDAFELRDKTESKLMQLSDSVEQKEVKTIVQGGAAFMQSIANQKEGQLSGVPSGYVDVDSITGGWQPSDLIIIAARPGMGKSSFICNCLRNAAVDFQFPVALFSLEMSTEQLIQRLYSSESEVEFDFFTKKKLTAFHQKQIVESTVKLNNSPIYIDDTGGLSVQELRSKVRKQVKRNGIKLVIVDYLQLLTVTTHFSNREQEIAFISKSLKNIAKEFNIPVIALSQLSRAVETRGGDKRPQLSDLRESGAIEQDADIVTFLYRPEYYKITHDENGQPTNGIMEAIIAKHRNGGLGTASLRFEGRYQKIRNNNHPSPF